jgi:hypothetical protein
MITYEQRLDANLDWALREGSKHFERESAVHIALRNIVRRLNEIAIPYAVLGSMAMFFHGFRRYTESIDLLVTPEGRTTIYHELVGDGYVQLSNENEYLRDDEYDVKIKLFVTAPRAASGKLEVIELPWLEEASTLIDGIRCLQLLRLVELKLVIGMRGPRYLKELGDVQQLIETLDLREDFVSHLPPLMQEKYKELWLAVRTNPP